MPALLSKPFSLFQDLLAKRFIRNVLILAGGTAAAQTLSLLLVPFITRLYSPAMFGHLGVFLSLVAILQVPALTGYHRAIPVCKSSDAAAALTLICGSTILIVTALASMFSFLYGERISTWVDPTLACMLPFVPCAALAAATYELATFCAVRNHHYRSLSFTKFAYAGGSSSVQLALGIFAFGAPGLVIGELLGRAVSAAILTISVLRGEWDRLRSTSFRVVVGTARQQVRFVIFGAPYLLTNQAGLYLPTLMLSICCGAKEAGAFFLAQRALQLPLAMIGRSVARVFLGEAAELWRTDPEQLHNLFQQTCHNLFKLAAIPMLGVAFFGPQLFGWLLSEQWAIAGQYGRILAIPVLINFAVAPAMQALTIIQREDWLLYWGIARVVFTTMAIALPASIGLSPIVSMIAFAIATAVTYVLGYRLVDHLLKCSPRASAFNTGRASPLTRAA